MRKEIEKRKKIALMACKQAGKILLDSFGRKIKVKSKGDRDLVSSADQKVDRAIVGLIRRHFPQDGIISEESPTARSSSGYQWIIDPIDGTHNFVHQIAIFGTSVAVAFQGQVVLGLIYLPFTDELYLAQKGKGAYRNGGRIFVSKRKLREATLVYDSTIRFDKKRLLTALGKLADQVFNIRMFGSTVRSLSYVAEGKAEAEIEFSDKVWDFAAGLLLVEEAGGICSDFNGWPWNINTRGYIAANAVVHRDMLKLLGRGA